MKIKTFILTFLMMSCSIVFGQGTYSESAKTEAQIMMHLANDEVGTITIANNISIGNTIEILNGRKVTIDLNGHELSTNEEIYIFKNFGKLTITDSDPEGKGTIIAPLGIYNGKPQTRTISTDINYNAQLTINGGKFVSTSSNVSAAIYNHLGVINIRGGEFYGEYSAITNYGMANIENTYIECLNRDNGAAAIINDFEIEYGENVRIVGRYTTATETGVITPSDYEPTYLFAELDGTKYPSLQAALDACTTGDNTINLLFHNSDNATVSQKEGVNITINGNGYKDKQFEYSGTIYVNGNSRHTGTETLTIQDINFITENDSHDFILCDFRKCNEAAQEVVRYAHNVTVQNCNFTATEAEEVVALRFRQSYNINVKDSEFTNLHSAMWATGTSGIAFDKITATNCKEGGISVATSTPVSVKNSIIEGAQYGVRADGSGNYSLNIEGGKLTAAVPVIVRNTTAEYKLTVNNNVELDATENGPQVVVTAKSDSDPYVVPTSDVNVTLYDNVTSTFGLTAKIGNAFYATLQDAVDNANDNDEIVLVSDVTEDVTITQKADLDLIINGDGKKFTGVMTVFGDARHDGNETLTIKDINFVAKNGSDACILSPDRTAQNPARYSYSHNVTVENCSFTDVDGNVNCAAIRHNDGGDVNWTLNKCTVDNTMHSLIQTNNVNGKLVIAECTVNSKNGVNLNSCTNVEMTGCNFDVQGYALRSGVGSGGNLGEAKTYVLANNTLKSACDDGDAVIMFRASSVDANFSMKENVVSGTTHISGNTAATKIAADENYWDGKEAPVVAEGSAPIVVNSYYSDATLSTLVRNEMGSIYAFVSNDRIFGDVTTNAGQSLVINIIGKDGNVIGTTSCVKPELMTGFNKQLTWRINLGADDSGSWAMEWEEGCPSINNMPAKVKLYVDNADVAEAEIRYTADGDGKSPVFAAKTNAEGKINSFIACTGEYNLNKANTFLNEALTAGDNVAITVAGTYAVPTGKNLTITGAVDGVKFNMASHVGIHSSMTFNNVTFEYSSNNDYVGLQHAGDMVYNNCTINGQVFLYGTSETFNNCTFNQTSSNAYNVWTYGAKEVAFNECTFNSAGKSVLIYSDQPGQVNDVKVVNCQLNASNKVAGKAAFEMDSSIQSDITLTIDAATTATGFDKGNVSGNSLWNNKKGNNDDANNDITVVVAGETVLEPVYEAQIEDKKFRNLTDAFAAATEGQTITLLGDATPALTSQRAITKAAVIELNGKTLTLAEDDLYFGTTTFQNGNIVVDPSVNASTAVFWMFENQTLTFDNVKLTATGVTGTYLIGINGGTGSNVNLLNGTNIIINNESQAGLSAVICDNGTGNNVKIENSDIDVKNIGGRFYLGGISGNITVDNTDIDLNGVKEGFYLRVNQTLSIGEHTTIDVVLNETEGRYGINFTDVNYTYTVAETATVNATVYEPVAIAQIGTIKYPTLQGAIDAVKDGETITLLAECDEEVTFTQTKDVSFELDGNDKTYTGSINITARAGKDAPSTLVIKNFNFVTDKTSHDFIKSVEKNYYPNNITITGCSFEGTSDINTEGYAVVAVRLRSANNIKIEDCTGTGLHSFLQNTAGWNLTIDNVDVNGAAEGGFALGTVQGVTVKNCEINSGRYGIRLDGQYNNNAVIESNKINAFIPVVVRKASVDGTITFNGTNEFTQSNTDGYWCVIGTEEYNTNGALPSAATAKINVTLNDTGLDRNGIYGNYGVAKIGNAVYNTFADALYAVQDGETITVLDVEGSEVSTEIEYENAIEFTITGEAPNYALPVVTFQNATVNISNAEILIPELDARQNATINVKKSIVKSATGNPIVKSYFNGRITIDESEVYTHQATTMGYIDIINGGKLNVTWQTNVYGNGLITVTGQDSEFRTAAFNLTAKDYNGRDNTDADRVGKPATVIVDDGATLIAGNVDSASGADYSYETEKYGINIGTEGKAALLDIKNGATVEFYMKPQENSTYKKPVIGADGTVNVNASTFNVKNRDEAQTLELANNGTVNVTGAASINIKNLTGKAINFTDVTIADAYIGGRVNAFGTNNFTGETNVTGILSLGYETNPTEQVIVNITGKFNGTNVIVYVNNGTDNVLNVGNKEGEKTTAHFANLGAFGDVNIVNTNVTYGYAYFRNDLNVTNSTMAISGGVNTYFSGNAKVVIDNSSWNLPGYANIGSYGGPDYKGNADVTLKNGSSMTATNLGVEQYDGKTVILTLEDSSTLTATNLSNTGSIVLANDQAKVTSNVFDNAPTTTVAYHKVNYVDGSYVVVAKDYVAQIYDVDNNTNNDRRYESLAEAATAAQNGETIQLLWNEGDAAISMAATFVGNKTVTITGTADVDWDKGWLYVGRNGEGNGKLIFKEANLTSKSVSTGTNGTGLNVSCKKEGQSTTNDGEVEIINSNIQLDYLIGKGNIKLDNSTLNVYEGFAVGARPASETGGVQRTVTMDITNGSNVIVKNHNGQGLGYESMGIMNIDATSTFKTTQSFLVTADGTMNVNGGNVEVAGTLTNNGTMDVAAESNVKVTGDLNVNGTLKSAGNITANIVKAATATIQLTGGIYTTEPQDSWCAENYKAFPYDETSWVVRETYGEQTFELTAGWNWVSSYITEFEGTEGLTMLQEGLGTNGIQIKHDNYTSNYRNNGWSGRLTSVSVEEMYKVNMSDDVNFKFEGGFVNYDECKIVLYPGWNYIGYPVNVETNLADALVILSADGQEESNGAKEGDVIKSQQGTATYIGSSTWLFSNPFNLVPGEGYMYYNTSDEVKFLRYTTKEATTTSEANTRSSKHWTVDVTQYPSNMTMIAMTDVEGGNYEVAAFVNGEVRGSSRPVYVESLDAYIIILTISGDDVEEMTFKCYDLTTGEEVEFSNRINYSNDAIVGSANEPYMLTRGTTGIGEAAISNVNIYPNPTTTGTEINLQATCDKVEVFNALGVKVVEYQNVDTIDALETAGIYVIRITNNGNVQNCRLVVK